MDIREEALTLLVSFRGEPELAYQVYDKIKGMEWSQDQKDRLDYELGIICYYVDKREEGACALDRLILREVSYTAALANMCWYLETIPGKWTPLRTQVPPGYRCLNPSIIKYQQGYLVNIRASNFAAVKESYFSLDPSGIVNTINYLQYLNADLEPQWTKPLEAMDILYSSRVTGLEDLRLHWNKGLIFTANSYNNHPHGVPRISLGKIALNGETLSYTLEHQPSPDAGVGCEKNWLPFSRKGQLYFLYDPFTIIRACPDQNKVVEKIPSRGKLRCAAGPVRYQLSEERGLLFLVHEVHMAEQGRVYLHRWCLWTKERSDSGEQRPKDSYTISLPFIFHYQGHEYASGLCKCPNGFLIGLSLKDRQAWLLEVSREQVDGMLSKGTRFKL